MNAFQIKCYLFPENTQRVSTEKIGLANEIRRFALTSVANGIYAQLIEKMQVAYGDLLPNKDEIRTYWIDEENELVGFSTDSEMQYAIDLQTAFRVSKPYDAVSGSSFSPNSVFKVYVQRRSVKQTAENVNNEPVVHPGVVCDGCSGSIVGDRFKCSVCADYDLCSACEGKGMHKEHPLTKIARPANRSCPYRWRRGMGGGGGGFGAGHCHRMPPPPRSGSFQESLNQFMPLITGSIPTVNNPEQLKSFGELMKTFLDPFGIDVDYFVSKNEKNTNENKEEEKPKEASPTAETNKSEAKVDEKPSEKMDMDKEETVAAASASVPPTTGTSIPPTESSSTPFEVAANALKAKIEESSGAPNVSQDVEDNGFNLIDISKELKYINSIETLKSMGYNDEGGWLTRLVIAKDGSINAVLDALNPTTNK